MKPYVWIVAAITLLAPANLCAEQAAMPGWMAGAWAHADGESWAEEYWTPSRAGIMIGASRSGKGEKLQFWEHMRIVREADGKLAFWAISGDQKPVRFVATKVSAEAITFENSQHDYPQRITYWREGKILRALISLIDRSNPRGFAFKLTGRD